jgi:hypothetical protein
MTRFEDRLKLLAPAPASDALRARIAYPGRRRPGWVVPMSAAAAGLLAALAFAILKGPTGTPAARNEAEREFRRIERALLEAKSLRVRFQRSAELQDPNVGVEKVQTAGVLLLKEGSRMALTLREARGAEQPKTWAVEWRYTCDGSQSQAKLLVNQGKQSLKNMPIPPKDLNAKLALSLARESLAVPTSIFATALDDLQKRLDVSEFSKAVDASGQSVLRYRVGVYEASLVYDPRTLVPLKRVLTCKGVGTFTEIYDECSLDVPLPDEQFRILPDAEDK